MDYSSPYGVTRAYETLFCSTGIHHVDRALMITLEIFTKAFYVLGFDLTPDRETDEKPISLPREGNLRIETRFKTLPEPVMWMLSLRDTSRSTTPETLK